MLFTAKNGVKLKTLLSFTIIYSNMLILFQYLFSLNYHKVTRYI